MKNPNIEIDDKKTNKNFLKFLFNSNVIKILRNAFLE